MSRKRPHVKQSVIIIMSQDNFHEIVGNYVVYTRLLRGLCVCYGFYVPLFLAIFALCGSYGTDSGRVDPFLDWGGGGARTSGVARIFFSVGGHWGPWIFLGGTNILSPPPPPQATKKRRKKRSSLFCRGGGGDTTIYKGLKTVK